VYLGSWVRDEAPFAKGQRPSAAGRLPGIERSEGGGYRSEAFFIVLRSQGLWPSGSEAKGGRLTFNDLMIPFLLVST
jgi:hypothetical protein